MPRQRDLESATEDMSANCLGLARRLAPPTGSTLRVSATLAYRLGAFRTAHSARLRRLTSFGG